MPRYCYTDEQLRTAVAESFSVAETLTRLGVKPSGGNYDTFRGKTKRLKIPTDHFTGQRWNKGMRVGPKRPIEDYLSNRVGIAPLKLRLRLIADGHFKHQCSCCLNTEWLGSPIPLELDHIDGNRVNNLKTNLRLLCPNCHAATPTYRGRNKGRYASDGSRTRTPLSGGGV